MIIRNIFFRCDFCQACLTAKTIYGGLIVNQKAWSDLLIQSPLFKERSKLYSCSICNNALYVTKTDSSIDHKDAKKAVAIEIKEYLSVLNVRKFDANEEKHIRIKYWQWCNGNRNEKLNVSGNDFSDDAIDNLNHLYNLLDMHNYNELIIMAEIKRELGLFDECAELISSAEYSPILEQILKMAKLKYANVFLLENK